MYAYVCLSPEFGHLLSLSGIIIRARVRDCLLILMSVASPSHE